MLNIFKKATALENFELNQLVHLTEFVSGSKVFDELDTSKYSTVKQFSNDLLTILAQHIKEYFAIGFCNVNAVLNDKHIVLGYIEIVHLGLVHKIKSQQAFSEFLVLNNIKRIKPINDF